MNQRAILYLAAAVIGIPVLIQIGSWSATDPLYAGISAFLVVSIIGLTQLGTRVWLLIPFFAAFGGSLNMLPGHFAPRDLAGGVVAVVLPALWVVRRFPIRVRFGRIEIALLVVLAFLGQAFIRNPTGLSVLGSSSVGGRPYFEIAVSAVAFVILSVQLVGLRDVRLMILANFSGHMVIACLDTVVALVPSVGYYMASIYNTASTGTALSKYFNVAADQSQGTGRLVFLRQFSVPIMKLVLSFRHPLQLLAPGNLGFLLLAVFAVVCMLLSGFRSGVAYLGLLGLAAMLFHRKPLHFVLAGAFGGTLLAVILVLQGTAFDLPLPAQRALSFLPANWDSRATSEAEGSSEWRYEMWREALTSERYIRNKWIGDGFGFTVEELNYQQSLGLGGARPEDMQDFFLMTGTYHSGPVETIKRIGYLGLVGLLIVMGVFFKESVSLVSRTQGTPYFPYAMFVALPLVVHPFMFVFIYGAFQGTLTTLLLGGGGLRLVGNSFEAWNRQRKSVSEGSIASGEGDRRNHAGLVGAPASS